MATKNYQWRAYASSDGPLSHGVTPDDTQWRTTTDETGSQTFSYWYRDSNRTTVDPEANSSRVMVNVTDSWSISINSRNYATIELHAVINSIVRDDIRGTPTTTSTGRDISIYRYVGGTRLWYTENDQIGSAHTISGTIDLGTETFTLAPGEEATRSSIYYHNQTHGLSSEDNLYIGVQFKNILPKDHRVGASLDANNGIWKSHNRVNGACHILPSAESRIWQEMRNIGDGTNQGDSPLILKAANANSWYDQRNLGKE